MRVASSTHTRTYSQPTLALALAGGVGLGRVALQSTVAVDAVPGAPVGDRRELFDVDVQQLAGVATLVAAGRLRRLEPRELARPTLSSTAETVDSAIARQNAISAPVIRSLRNSTITSTSSSDVRCGIDFGAEERSSSPASPSARYA
jgi:hypothetical protein